MDSLNVIALVGFLERAPVVRFDPASGTARCSVTIRLEEVHATTGATFRLFVPLDAAGKLGEQLSACQAGDLVSVVGKLSWKKYVTAKGEEKSTLAVFVRQVSVLQAVAVPAGVEEG